MERRISESVSFLASAARFACPHCVAAIVRAFKLAAGGRLGEHSPPLSRIESFKYFHTPKNSIQCGGATNQSDSGGGSIRTIQFDSVTASVRKMWPARCTATMQTHKALLKTTFSLIEMRKLSKTKLQHGGSVARNVDFHK